MTKKVHISYDEIEDYVDTVKSCIERKEWKPDLIVGLSRGGLLPAVRLSHKMKIPMVSLVWATRDENGYNVTDCGLAEEASEGKKILIVDDICDSAETFRSLKEDWDNTVVKDIPWHEDVRFAALLYKESSQFEVEYMGGRVVDDSIWWVFPWEEE